MKFETIIVRVSKKPLFVLFINDLPGTVNSDTYLFADDTKIFKIITASEDSKVLQDDLNTLSTWSDNWLLKFHPDKCKVMHIGKKSDRKEQYYLRHSALQQAEEEKDIGVIIDRNLSFDKHISEKVYQQSKIYVCITQKNIQIYGQ